MRDYQPLVFGQGRGRYVWWGEEYRDLPDLDRPSWDAANGVEDAIIGIIDGNCEEIMDLVEEQFEGLCIPNKKEIKL